MQSEVNYDDYILYINTMHGTTLKTLTEALKDLIVDVNMNFNHKKAGILKMDEGRTLLVYLKLIAEQFDDYHIMEPLVAGIPIPLLHKCLKTMNNNDNLYLYIKKDDPNKLVVLISNAEKGAVNKYDLPVLEINEDEIAVPALDFSFMLIMNPVDFQKICRDMKSMGTEKVQITYSKNRLCFKANGDVSQEIIRQPGKDKLSIVYNNNTSENEIYSGVFELKKLFDFTKCTSLSNDVKLLLKNDYPLVFKYDVGDLGEVQLCLAPATSETMED